MNARKKPDSRGLLVLVAAAAAYLCLLSSCSTRRSSLDPSGVLVVKKGRFTNTIPARGVLESLSITPVAAKEVNVRGLTLTKLLPEGSAVKAGDVIAEFDPTEVLHSVENDRNALDVQLKEIEKAEAKANAERDNLAIDLEQATLALRLAESKVKRLHPKLYARNDIIEAELDLDLAAARVTEMKDKLATLDTSGQADVEVLRIEERRLRSRIDDSQKSLESMKLAASCDGVLIFKDYYDLKPGDVVWPGWPFCEIHQFDRLRAKVYVLEKDVGILKDGQAADVVIDAFPNRHYAAVVERVDTLARSASRGVVQFVGGGVFASSSRTSEVKYFECALSLPEMDAGTMRPGMPVTVAIHAADIPEAIAVPVYAVFDEDGKTFVYLVNEGDPQRRDVTLGPRSKSMAVVVEGLAEGDRIALRNPHHAFSGPAKKEDVGRGTPERS